MTDFDAEVHAILARHDAVPSSRMFITPLEIEIGDLRRRIATEAERRGAERMRERAAALGDTKWFGVGDAIRALPLDADEVQQ